MAAINFNAASVAPQQSFEPLPAGDYIAQITESSIKPTKSGTGMVLNLTWTILDGQYTNRKVFDRVNVANQNPEAERIGQSQLSAICHAIGVMNLQDSNQLHGRPCKIKLKVRKDDQYGDSNEVKGVSAVGNMPSAGQVPFAPQQQAPAAAPWGQQPAAPAPAAAPWANKAA